jgi:YVTN family beta-propeller protein
MASGLAALLPGALARATPEPGGGARIGVPFETNVSVGHNPVAVAFDADNGSVYVANEDSHTVSVISAKTNKVIATIKTGSYLIGLGVNSETNQIDAVGGNDEGGTLSIINGHTNKVAATVSLGPMGDVPEQPTIDEADNTVYVPDELSDGNMYEVDANLDILTATIGIAPVSQFPTLAVFNPATSLLYVVITTGAETTAMAVYDTIAGTVKARFTLPDGPPAGAAFDPDTGMLYVSGQDTDNTDVINTSNDHVVKQVGSSGPWGLTFDPAANAVAVADTFGGSSFLGGVQLINATTNTATASFNVPASEPEGIDVDPVTGTMYVADTDVNKVSVITEPTCAVAGLTASFGKLGGGFDARELTLRLEHTGRGICKLDGFAALVFLRHSGTTIKLTINNEGKAPGSVLLPKGQSAHICLRFDAAVAPFVAPYSVRITAPGDHKHLTLRWPGGRIGRDQITVSPLLPGAKCA